MSKPIHEGDTITNLETVVDLVEPMTEAEVLQLLDDLLEKGFIEVVLREDGELGFQTTKAGRAAYDVTLRAEIVN